MKIKSRSLEVIYILEKPALICLFILLIGTLPVLAANSDNTNHEKQLQRNDQQSSQSNVQIIKSSLKKIGSFLTQNDLKEDIKEICSDMNKELVIKNNPRSKIERSVRNQIIAHYIDSINQINNNSSQIKSLINQNEDLKKEIKNLEETHETVQQGINSTKNKINSNSSEIKSLIDQNNELTEKIQNMDENITN
jgi:chromosome segregation ATPase